MYKQVFLKAKKEESLKRFHPWVFSGAISHTDKPIEEGEIVEIYDSNKNFIAIGHSQIGSIAVRVLSFEKEEIDADFWVKRIHASASARISLGVSHNQTHSIYRLVHGEGDLLPGLIVDVYGKTAVMQAHSIGMHVNRQAIADAIIKVLSTHVSSVYYKSSGTLPYKAEIEVDDEFLIGNTDEDTALENGLAFHIDWLRGQKTGFFIDQRDNRSLLERYASGKSILNMFCYTGGFSVYALRGGATMVHSVDSSAKAIDLTNKNVKLNFPTDSRHTSFATDAFKFLAEMNDVYDIIVLDPPAFAKHRDALKNALQGYKRLNAKAIEKIKPGGILFTFSCSQIVSKEQFRLAVFSAAAMTGRHVRILHQLTQPADHPISIYHPEGEYLKGLVLLVE
jgi:23S rRNA (cytosine1962-C5)-methyltransferase